MVSMPAHLTYKNGLNLFAVVLLFFTTIPWDFGPDYDWLNRVDDFGRFETIVTPSEGIFFFPKLILMFEVVFGIVQLLPRYGQSPLVQDGVSHYFAMAAVFQLFSSLCFDKAEGDEGAAFWLFVNIVLLGAMTGSLLQILISQNLAEARAGGDEDASYEDYWLLRFPFNLHAGWNIGIFIVSVNNWFKFLEFGAFIQAVLAILSLGAFGAIAVKMLKFNGNQPNYVIPAVLAFFTFGIAIDFRGPGVEDLFDGWVIVFFILFTTVLCLAMAVGTSYLLYKKLSAEESGNDDTGDDIAYQGSEMVANTEPAVSTSGDAEVAVV